MRGRIAGTFAPAFAMPRGVMADKMLITVNNVPTLTTRNFYLVVMSVRDIVSGTPDDQREYFRKLTGAERLALQGFPQGVSSLLPPWLVAHAAGNAYPPPLIIAVLGPMLLALQNSKVWRTWPEQAVFSNLEPPEVDQLARACSRPARVVNRAKHAAFAEATASARKRRRRRRSDSP